MLLATVDVLRFILIMLGMDIAFSIGLAALAFIAISKFDARPINPVLTRGWIARRHGLPQEARMSAPERMAALKGGLLPLGAPIILITNKVLCIATPTESAAVVVLLYPADGGFLATGI